MDGESEATQAAIGTNIRGRFFTAYMLFARGEREHKTALAIGINCLSTNTTRHLAHKFLAAGKKPNMRPAKIKPNAKALPFADNDIRTLLAR